MSEQEKIALSETQRAFVTPVVGGLAAGTVAYGLPAALDKVREVRVRRNRDTYIKAMKDVHPDLKGIPERDLHIAYNSMAMHSPHVLRDPLLGGQELLRMSKYRQADINSLNEINKLRGNSMMDQAFMNATNMVASGVSDGFKGYQAQRQADADQAYRERMDIARAKMDEQRMQLERDKFDESKRQFGESYTQRENQFGASFNQRENQFGASFDQREDQAAQQDAYNRDRDAMQQAQWEATHGLKQNKDVRDEISFINAQTQLAPVLDARGNPQTDTYGQPMYVVRRDKQQAANDLMKHNPIGTRAPSFQPPPPASTKYRKSKYTRTKKASAEHIYDIVARLRDRNL
jgi:phage-related protein